MTPADGATSPAAMRYRIYRHSVLISERVTNVAPTGYTLADRRAAVVSSGYVRLLGYPVTAPDAGSCTEFTQRFRPLPFPFRGGVEMPKEERGVYYARHTIDGCQVLYAVKSDGDRLPKVIVLRPMIDRAAAEDHMWRQLDRLDPVAPRLALVLVQRNTPEPEGPPISSTAFAMARARRYQQQGILRRLS